MNNSWRQIRLIFWGIKHRRLTSTYLAVHCHQSCRSSTVGAVGSFRFFGSHKTVNEQGRPTAHAARVTKAIATTNSVGRLQAPLTERATIINSKVLCYQ